MIVKRISRCAAGVLSLLLIAANGITAKGDGSTGPPGDSCSITIPFAVYDNKGWIPDGTYFTVTMEAVDDAPLPETTFYEINVTGEYEFGPILFDEPGDHEYTIHEVVYDNENIIFDRTIYHVHAVILYNDDGELVGGFALTKEGSGEKPEEVDFTNDYTEPPDSSSLGESSVPEESSDTDSSSDRDSSKDTGGGGSRETDSSSKSQSSWGDLLPPNTGGAVTLGFSGLIVAALAVMTVSRKKNESEDEPPDDGTG